MQTDDNPDQTKPHIIIKLFKDKNENYCHWITTKEEQLQLLKEYHDNQLGVTKIIRGPSLHYK